MVSFARSSTAIRGGGNVFTGGESANLSRSCNNRLAFSQNTLTLLELYKKLWQSLDISVVKKTSTDSVGHLSSISIRNLKILQNWNVKAI